MKLPCGVEPIRPKLWSGLIKSFLQRLPLPRLLHFVDLALPQMVPASFPSQSTKVTFPGSQLIRDQWIAKDEGRPDKAINIIVTRLFKSHAEIEHLTVNWNGHPVLLFADMDADEYASVWQYQSAKERNNGSQERKHGASPLHFLWSPVPGHSHDVWVTPRQQRRRYYTQVMEACAAPPDGICVATSRPCRSFLPSSSAAQPKQAVWYAWQLCCPTDIESHYHIGPTILYRR